jgi:enoyl-CoA hydratase
MKTISELSFEELTGLGGNLGIITLTRQQALNALNHNMFLALYQQLTEWEKAPQIKAVVINAAEGRAFCAGGDIRHAYELKKANDPTLEIFFRDEYQMNKRIHHFSKPYIALLDGITMGGGVGISIHGSHRVGTEKLLFSMPETGIGFYPDVGTTYSLSRFPHKMGFYLGLSGVRIEPADCAAIGIVQHLVKHDDLEKLTNKLKNTTLVDNQSVTEIIKQFAVNVEPSKLMAHKDKIEKYFSQKTVEEIVQGLENDSDEWCQQTAKIIRAKSPTSLKVTLAALQKAEHMNFDACMQMEYRLTCRFLQGHDFFEGIRAAIIDKDQAPKWKPEKLEEVNVSQVEKYFAPMERELV